MKRFTAASLWALALAFVLFSARPAHGQDIVIGAGSSFHGSGTYNVHGNIDNSATTNAADTLHGTINLIGTTAAEVLGATVPLHIDTLLAGGTTSKTMNVPVTVNRFTIHNGAANSFNVNGQTLTITGPAADSSGSLVANGATDKVIYSGAANQEVLGTTYTTLQLINTGAKSLGGAVVAADVTHTGGALTVNNSLTVNTTGAFATIADVTGTGALHSKGTTTVDALDANSGAVTADSGSVTFNGPAVNTAGSLTATNKGDLKFNAKVVNNGTLAANSDGKAWFSDSVNGAGTYTFDSLSTVYYQQAAGTQDVVPTTYGSLQLKNSKKLVSNALTVKGDLDLDSSLVMPTGKSVTLTSTKPRNVSGAGEVVGTVVRTNAFSADSLYTFNSANAALSLNETINGGTMQLTLHPDSVIPHAPSQKYVKRVYSFAGLNLDTAKLRGISLAYSDAELNNIISENKLGIRDYRASDSTWSKLTNANRSRVNDATGNYVYVDSVFASLNNVSDFALVNVAFGSLKSGSWNIASTWDEGVPSKLDDAEINPSHIVTVDSDTSVASVALVDSTAELKINTGSLAVTTQVDNFGTITVGNGVLAKTMALDSHLVNRRKVIVAQNSTLAIKGKLQNFGDVTNDGIIDIGQ